MRAARIAGAAVALVVACQAAGAQAQANAQIQAHAVTGPDVLDALRTVIAAADYNCSYVNKAWGPTSVQRGTEFRVQCDGGAFLYRVIVTPSERFIVEPR